MGWRSGERDMSVQWFPGHMARARRKIREILKWIDIVFELVDARAPRSTRNPESDALFGEKLRVVILNKEDLADPAVTKAWLEALRGDGTEAVALSADRRGVAGKLSAVAERLLAAKREAWRRRGIRSRPVRALVAGIPNVGKSTLINALAGRSAAATGDRPGITRGQQWIRVGLDLELLDTPGLLWPKIDDPRVALRLAATGAVKDELFEAEEAALFLLDVLKRHYPDRLRRRYGADVLVEGSGPELLEAIGRKRGCLAEGGRIRTDRAAAVLLHDFRTGKLGGISLERPSDEG